MRTSYLECADCGKLLPTASIFCDYCGTPDRRKPRQSSGTSRGEKLLYRAGKSTALVAVTAIVVATIYYAALGLASMNLSRLNQDAGQASTTVLPAAQPAPAPRPEPAADLNLKVQVPASNAAQTLSSRENIAAVRTLPEGLLLTTSPELARAPAGVKSTARIGTDSLIHEKIGGDDTTGTSWLTSPEPWDGTGMRVAPPESIKPGDKVFSISLTPGNAVTGTAGSIIESEGKVISVRLDNQTRQEHGILVTTTGCLAGINLPARQDRGGAYPNTTRAVNAARLPPLLDKADATCAATPGEPAQVEVAP